MIISIFIFLYFTSFSYLPDILNNKTKPKNEKYLTEPKYILLFMFVNVLCFLFLDKIRECRKINHYKNRVLNFEQNFIDIFGLDYLTNESKKEYLKMCRYLKMKKIKL